MESWFRNELRRRAQRQWITWAVLTLLLCAWALADLSYWRNFFAGPEVVSGERLASLARSPNVPARDFLTVSGRQVVDTGVRDQEVGDDGVRRDTGSYYALLTGGHLLVVRSSDAPPLTITGELKPLTAEIDGLLFSGPDPLPSDATLPLMLDAHSFRLRGYLALGAGAVWCALIWFFGLRSFRRAQDIDLHPAMVRVNAWPMSFEEQMNAERELATAVRVKGKGVLLTDNFVIQRRYFVFNVYRLRELVWAYPRITTRRLYGVIPISKRSAVVMNFQGGTLASESKKAVVAEMLEFLQQRAPWTLFGYSKELAKLWKRSPQQFLLESEARRATLDANAPQKTSLPLA